ncbi:MAG: MTH938/NDUFAF3 family protein [Spirochaetaceae bacterium]
MHADRYEFGSITIDGHDYDYDLVIESGTIRKRVKKPSKPLKAEYGHTPLSAREEIPLSGRRLIIGTGAYGRLPVLEEVYNEARERGIQVDTMPTPEAIKHLDEPDTDFILHLTC